VDLRLNHTYQMEALVKKILVSGDVCGQFGTFFTKVAQINQSKAGPFAALFVVGTIIVIMFIIVHRLIYYYCYYFHYLLLLILPLPILLLLIMLANNDNNSPSRG
jgi:hypothetical protein